MSVYVDVFLFAWSCWMIYRVHTLKRELSKYQRKDKAWRDLGRIIHRRDAP